MTAKSGRGNISLSLIVVLLMLTSAVSVGDTADEEAWIPLFNGSDLEGWTPKIRLQSLGSDTQNTFRVEEGFLTVSYENYPRFNMQFGHLFYEIPFSHYRLRVVYRFVGEPMPDTPEWAARNSGVMLHAQAANTMRAAQDFPISIELQFLGGIGDGKTRPTANVCSPGTRIEFDGVPIEEHCVDSSSATYDGNQWVYAEAFVLGNRRIVHYVNGQPVIEYANPTIGGGVVSGHDPAMKPEGEPMEAGYIALQSVGHPIQFRRVELLNLKGCMDKAAANFKRYFLEDDKESCAY